MIVTVLMYARIDKHPPGSVVEYDNGPHVHRLLKSGKVGLVDPPALEMIEGYYGKSEHLPSKPEPVRERLNGSPSEGSGKTGSKRSSGRNPERSGGQVGEDGSGPPSGATEGFIDDRIYE